MTSLALQPGIIPTAIFLSALLGSGHCVGMCGPISSIIATSKPRAFVYHFGRLISYITLGIVSVTFGNQLLSFFPQSAVSLIAPIAMGSTFLLIGIMILTRRHFQLNLPSFFSKPLSYFLKKNDSLWGPFLIGTFSITLPCGWLYGHAIGAGTTQSYELASIIMLMFWLGTVPSLLLTPWLVKTVLTPLKTKFPYLSAVVLCLFGGHIIAIALMRVLS